MGSAIPNNEDLTYDSPSAFLEAMEYGEESFTDLHMPHFNHNHRGIKQHTVDPLLNQQYPSFNPDSNKWRDQRHLNHLDMLNNNGMSPLNANFSYDTGYGSNEASPDKSTPGVPPKLFANDNNNEMNTAEPAKNTSKTRKRSKAATETVPKQEPKPASRKTRRTSMAASVATDDMDGADDAKREQFLARNREAASKCRQKKKQWTSNLEDQARELSFEKQMLTTQAAMLKNELLMLKCKCLEHSNCDCEAIREYLKHTVTNLPPANAALYSKIEDESAYSRKGSVYSNVSHSETATSPRSVNEELDYFKVE